GTLDLGMVRLATGAFRATDDSAELLSGAGSGVPLVTLARFTIGSGLTYPEGTESVVVMVRVAPGRRFPRAQGNAVVQSPLLETKSRPGGVGSDTVTPVATDGPRFVTVTVKTRL